MSDDGRLDLQELKDPALAATAILRGCARGKDVFLERPESSDLIALFEGEASSFDVGRLTSFYSFVRHALLCEVRIIGGEPGCFLIYYRASAPAQDVHQLVFETREQSGRFRIAETMKKLAIAAIDVADAKRSKSTKKY